MSKRGVSLILDQTYKNLSFAQHSMTETHRETTYYVYSIPKDAAAPALRIGCVVGNSAVISKLSDVNSMFFSCSPKLLQRLALSYLREGWAENQQRIRDILGSRIEIVPKILGARRSLTFIKPNAGMYFYLNVSKTGIEGSEFSRRLLLEKGVCVLPGIGFGPSGINYVRISIAGDEEELYRGCSDLASFAEALEIAS